MRLIKEVIKGEEYGKTTIFNADGQPTSIVNSGHLNNLKQDFIYDEQRRVTTIQEEEYCEDQRTERTIKKYEYNGKDYRVLTYLTHQRTYNDYNSDILEGIETWHSVDKLISVQEVKFKGKKNS